MGGVIIQAPSGVPSHLPRVHPEGGPPELQATLVAVRAIAPPAIPGIAEVPIALDTTTEHASQLLVPPVIRAIALAEVLRIDNGLPFCNQLAVGVCVNGPASGIQLTGATAPAT